MNHITSAERALRAAVKITDAVGILHHHSGLLQSLDDRRAAGENVALIQLGDYYAISEIVSEQVESQLAELDSEDDDQD